VTVAAGELEVRGPCPACGKARGTGTLLDLTPEPPAAALEQGAALETWQAFAVRYRCPACAGALDVGLKGP